MLSGLYTRLAIGVAVVAVAGGLVVRDYAIRSERDAARADAATAKAALETAVQRNRELKAAFDGQMIRHRRELDELHALSRRRATTDARLNAIREENRDAEDGDVSDVLRCTIDGLYGTEDRDPRCGPGDSRPPESPAAID